MNAEFDKYAPAYSRLLNDPIKSRFANGSQSFHRRKQRLISDFLGHSRMAPSRMSWLDVGCGQGDLLRIAGTEFARAVGCDPSSEMVRGCQATEVLQQSSPTDLPFPDESFNLVTAVCVYHHVERTERDALTRSIRRVLNRGGLFCMIEHNPWNPITQLIVKRCPLDAQAQLLNCFAASRLMRSAGLEVVETSYFLYLPDHMFARYGWIENAFRKFPMGGQFACFGLKAAV